MKKRYIVILSKKEIRLLQEMMQDGYFFPDEKKAAGRICNEFVKALEA